MDYFIDGVEAFDSADYGEAVHSFNKAIELDPSNLEYRYYLGLTYIRLDRDNKALEIFESIVKKDPENYFKAYFDISAIYTKQKKYRKAIDTLNTAEQTNPQSARVSLEKGYTFKKVMDYEQAIQSFKRAKAIDPKLSQIVAYDIATVHFEKEEFDQAHAMFQEAIGVDPDTPLAEIARQSLKSVEGTKRARKPWHITSSVTWAYDDNVPLDPLEMLTPRTGPVQDKKDQFQIFTFKGVYKFINRKDLEVGAGYSFYCTGYKEWFQNNVLAHTPHIYLQYNYKYKNLFLIPRLQYDYSYYYAGGKSNGQDNGLFLTFGSGTEDKLKMQSIMPAITIIEPYNLKSEIILNIQKKRYLDGVTPGAASYSGVFIQSYKFPKADIYPRIGYKYGEEIADRDDFSYRYHEGFVGISASLVWDIMGDLSIAQTRTSYHNRRDKTYTTSVSLHRLLLDYLQLQLFYNHTHNSSNWQGLYDPHKFKKNMYLCSLTFMF